MSWRKEIRSILQENPRTYSYTPDGNFDSPWRPYSALRTRKISRPLRRPLQLPGGHYDFVIVQPYIKKLLGIKRVTLVINDRDKKPHFHGHLAGRRNVYAAGGFAVVNDSDKSSLVTTLTNGSGHYTPGAESIDVAEKIMKAYKIRFANPVRREIHYK